jgi:mono/diheme cytochrome c family protein
VIRARLLLAVAAVAAVSFAGCTAETTPTPSDPGLAEGQAVFDSQCASCHGRTGNGGLGPKLAGVVEDRYPDIDDQIAVIANGLPGTNMPAFDGRLSADEIRLVARYEREVLGTEG